MSDNEFVTMKDFEAYKKDMEKRLVDGGKVKKAKRTRAPNAYNLFIQDFLKKTKATNSEISNQEAFKMGAAAWKEHKAAKAAESAESK